MRLRKRANQRWRTAHGPGCAAIVLALAMLGTIVAIGDEWPPAPVLQASPDESPGALPPSVRAEAASGGVWKCTFRFKPEVEAKSVTLAGTFTGWNPSATPMTGPDAGGYWTASIDLPAAVHQYKFVVNGERWFPDPQNTDNISDGKNGLNSVVRLGRLARMTESGAKVGDGQVEVVGLEHNPASPQYFQCLPGGQVLVRLRTLAHDVEGVSVAVEDVGTAAMTLVNEGPLFALWEGKVDVQSAGGASADSAKGGPAGGCKARYTFILSDGALRGSGPDTYGALVLKDDVVRTPDWAKHAIWYQIMLDRFRNGNPANDQDPVRPWTSEWFSISPWEQKDDQTFYKWIVFDRFYGGDFDGLEEKLPYLRELGVNALYLLPVFKAQSNHKYNATNYIHIDDHFGTRGDYEAVAAREDLNDPNTWQWTESDKRFLKFLKAAHAQGFKVIIDGVFNHVGTAHPAFVDVKEHGKKSPYADWFEITSWKPFKYTGWAGFDALPTFKKSKDGVASEAVKEHIYNVTRRWMAPNGDVKAGIDGWRLDVPNEVPAPFWVGWRQLVKSINPEAYICGEIWDRADQWLDGKHFDAVMNYEFSRPTVAWMFNRKLKISPSEFDRRLRELRLAYPLEATQVLQNLLDSHDTDRVASMALNPDRIYNENNRPQLENVTYNNDKPGPAEYAKVRLAALLQMTYVGAPMIWYGDEVGTWGAADPTGRKPMLWEDLQPYEKPEENFVMKDQLAFYKEIIALRKAHPALRTGTVRTLLTDDEADAWAFLRSDADEQLIVVLNASDKERAVTVPLPLNAPNPWKGVFGVEGNFKAADHKLQLTVPPVAGIVLHSATPK